VAAVACRLVKAGKFLEEINCDGVMMTSIMMLVIMV
jgi:hypothetical protein